MMFKNRAEAGLWLVDKLKKYQNDKNAIVLGLPRGGVVTASVIAKALKLPLDILVSRKIGAPFNPELAMGALSPYGDIYLNIYIMASAGVLEADLKENIAKEKIEAARRLKVYREGRPPLDLKNKIAIIVDDGIATGATMHTAILSARKQEAAKVVVAAPVIAGDNLAQFQKKADELVYFNAPEDFSAVGQFYEDFPQVRDEEVIKLLNQ